MTADAATPTPVNNESAGAEGAEFIAQDLSQDPPGNDDLLYTRLKLALPAPWDAEAIQMMEERVRSDELDGDCPLHELFPQLKRKVRAYIAIFDPSVEDDDIDDDMFDVSTFYENPLL